MFTKLSHMFRSRITSYISRTVIRKWWKQMDILTCYMNSFKWTYYILNYIYNVHIYIIFYIYNLQIIYIYIYICKVLLETDSIIYWRLLFVSRLHHSCLTSNSSFHVWNSFKRMNSEMQFCWCLQTSRICPTPWLSASWPTNSACRHSGAEL